MTGVSWDVQLAAALTAAAFGAAASPLTLLYGGSFTPIVRFAADFLATAGIGALFLVSAEVGAEGQLTVYCAVCYFAALCAARKTLLAAAAALKKAFPSLFRRKTPERERPATISPQDGNPAPVSSRYSPPQAEKRISAFRRGEAGRAAPRRQADGWD